MSSMTYMQQVITLICGAGALSIVMMATKLFFQERARTIFRECCDKARDAGVEDAFMTEFNSIARYGDSLDAVINRWGSCKIRHMATKAIARGQGTV